MEVEGRIEFCNCLLFDLELYEYKFKVFGRLRECLIIYLSCLVLELKCLRK